MALNIPIVSSCFVEEIHRKMPNSEIRSPRLRGANDSLTGGDNKHAPLV
jgi:hypothetical protein